MTLTLHVVLAATELDDPDLVGAAMGHNLGGHRSALQRVTQLDAVGIAEHQDVVELDLVASFDFEFFHAQGFTLNDAVLGGIANSRDPLRSTMARVQRNVQLGVALDDAVSELAELHGQDELRLFALGLRINQRYGGNASELMENLIKLIREREQGIRQLKAMTGETRITAIVLGSLPLAMVGYFLIVNPHYLMAMWRDGSGQLMLLLAFALQVLGCLVLWRMMRSL